MCMEVTWGHWQGRNSVHLMGHWTGGDGGEEGRTIGRGRDCPRHKRGACTTWGIS